MASTISNSDLTNILLGQITKTEQLQAEKMFEYQLESGDQIYRYGAIFESSQLTHHGIYIGNGEVIHFAGGDGNSDIDSSIKSILNDMKIAKIEVISYPEFTLGKDCYKVVGDYQDKSIILNRAYSQLNTKFITGYSPAKNNCEHFANWCRTGIKYSLQSKSLANIFTPIFDKISVDKKKEFENVSDIIKLLISPIENNSNIAKITTTILDIGSVLLNIK